MPKTSSESLRVSSQLQINKLLAICHGSAGFEHRTAGPNNMCLGQRRASARSMRCTDYQPYMWRDYVVALRSTHDQSWSDQLRPCLDQPLNFDGAVVKPRRGPSRHALQCKSFVQACMARVAEPMQYPLLMASNSTLLGTAMLSTEGTWLTFC